MDKCWQGNGKIKRFASHSIKKMKEIIDFLRDLSYNNNREWFNVNKQRYEEVLSHWHEFCEKLIQAVGQFDPDIACLTVKDCTYRIYRDTRFSADKSPYKTHFGVFMFKPGLVKRVSELFKTVKPFNDYINRAVDFKED